MAHNPKSIKIEAHPQDTSRLYSGRFRLNEKPQDPIKFIKINTGISKLSDRMFDKSITQQEMNMFSAIPVDPKNTHRYRQFFFAPGRNRSKRQQCERHLGICRYES